MQLKIKHILGLSYLVAGFVWCILNLPNLMARAKGSAILATGLTILRVLLWPVFIFLATRSKGDTSEEGAPDGESTKTTD